MKATMKLSVLRVCLEGVVVRRMGPKWYMDGMLTILRAKRTGTLLLDGWELFEKPNRSLSKEEAGRWLLGRCPTYISLEDVRTFGIEENLNDQVDKKTLSAMRLLGEDRETVLKQTWMPRGG